MGSTEELQKLRMTHDSDPAVALVSSFDETILRLLSKLEETMPQYLQARRLFFAGLQEMSPTHLPSDANFTMRLSYGSVVATSLTTAAWYDYYTTEVGILEKQDPPATNVVQPEILEMIRNKDFGEYADAEGHLRVNFISNNDITGGNSGSPVFNGRRTPHQARL